MRKKEGLADYRYFPEPDLPEVVLMKEYIDEIRRSLPELPEPKRRRYEKMGLSMQDVLFLANDSNVSLNLIRNCFVKNVYNSCIMVDVALQLSIELPRLLIFLMPLSRMVLRQSWLPIGSWVILQLI